MRRRPLYFTAAEQKATRTDKTPPKTLKVSGMSAALRAAIANECSLDTVEDYVGVAVCNQCYSRLRKMSKRAAAAAVTVEDHLAIPYTPGSRAQESGVLTATPSAVLQHLSRVAAARVTQSRVKSAMVVDTAGSGSGDEEPQYVPHPDLYALTRDAPIATVDDVQNLMNMLCGAHNLRCVGCGNQLVLKLWGVHTKGHAAVATVTPHMLLACSDEACSHVFAGREYRGGSVQRGAKGMKAATAAALRLALGGSSSTLNLQGAAAVSAGVPSLDTVQCAAVKVTEACRAMAAVVAAEQLADLVDVLEAVNMNVDPRTLTEDARAKFLKTCPVFASFDGFYNSLASRNAQWVGTSLCITSRATGVSVPLVVRALSTLTLSSGSLHPDVKVVANAKGAEFQSAQVTVQLCREAGVRCLPVVVADNDAKIEEAFSPIAGVTVTDRNHHLKALTKHLSKVDKGQASPVCPGLPDTLRGTVWSECREAMRGPESHAAMPSRNTGQAGADAHLLPSPVSTPALHGVAPVGALDFVDGLNVEELWHKAKKRSRVSPPLLERLRLISHEGEVHSADKERLLQHLASMQREESLQREANAASQAEAEAAALAAQEPDVSIDASGGRSGAVTSAAGGDPVTDSVVSGPVLGSNKKTVLKPVQIRAKLMGLVSRNLLQCARRCVEEGGDPTLMRGLCEVWLQHYEGDHSDCARLFPASAGGEGCRPSMAPLPKGGATMTFLRYLVDQYIGHPGFINLSASGLALMLHSNGAESFGAAVRHYVPKSLTFRRRWEDGVWKRYLDVSVGEVTWRQQIGAQLGAPLLPAAIKFWEGKRRSRLARQAFSNSGEASLSKIRYRKRARAMRNELGAEKLYKYGSADKEQRETWVRRASAPALAAVEKLVDTAAAQQRFAESLAAAGKQLPLPGGARGAILASLVRTSHSGGPRDKELTAREARHQGFRHGKLRWLERWGDEGPFIVKDLHIPSQDRFVQVFFYAVSGDVQWPAGIACPPQRPATAAAESKRGQIEVDEAGRVTYMTPAWVVGDESDSRPLGDFEVLPGALARIKQYSAALAYTGEAFLAGYADVLREVSTQDPSVDFTGCTDTEQHHEEDHEEDGQDEVGQAPSPPKRVRRSRRRRQPTQVSSDEECMGAE